MNATIIAIAALILSVINLIIGVILVVKVTNLADYEEIHVETNRELLKIDSDFTKHQIEWLNKWSDETQEFKTSLLDCIEKDHDTTTDLHKKLLNLVSMDHDIHYGLTKSLNGLIEDSTKVNDERWNLICDYITNDKADSDVPKWIPVTERLPECEWGAEVGNIEWISHGMVSTGCFGRGGKYRDAYFRTWTDGAEGMDAKDADYWRQIQIPEPLKEKTE